MQIYNYVQAYCAPTEDPAVIKAELSVALDSLVAEQKIRNLRSVTGMRGTYTLLPAGLLAAAQALRLNDGDIGLLMGIGVSKIVKQ